MKPLKQRLILVWIAVIFGLALMVGESVRSFGQGRPFFAWFDDFIIAFFLFYAAYMASRSPKNIKFLSAAFGICFAGLSMSYLSKIFNPTEAIYSNVSFQLLTALLLIALLASLTCMIWTLAVDFGDQVSEHED